MLYINCGARFTRNIIRHVALFGYKPWIFALRDQQRLPLKVQDTSTGRWMKRTTAEVTARLLGAGHVYRAGNEIGFDVCTVTNNTQKTPISPPQRWKDTLTRDFQVLDLERDA